MVRTAYSATGQAVTQNVSLPRKQENQQIKVNAPVVPTGHSNLLPPLASLDPPMRRLIIAARDLFAKRPIYTRRALFNSLPAEDLAIIGQNATKHIPQFVGYAFEAGPWSKTIIRYGVDPRKDKELRIYQTMTFHLDEPIRKYDKNAGKAPKKAGDVTKYMSQQTDSHIFDGTTFYTDGKVWQFCDITDPLLTPLTNIDDLREECHIELDGWFHNGTVAKIRTIMKKKLVKYYKGEEMDESLFDRLLTLPEIYNPQTTGFRFAAKYWKGQNVGREEARILEHAKIMAIRTHDGPVPSKDREAEKDDRAGERVEDGGNDEVVGEQEDPDRMLIDDELDPVREGSLE